MIIDIKRAFFHSVHSGTVHVLPPHLKGAGLCWRLKMSMYGTLLAAGDFQDAFVKCLKEECKLVGGESSPCIYHDPKCDLQAAYHGDDVVAVAYAEDLDKFTEKLGRHFELVVKATLGPEVGDDKKASLLNRLLTGRTRDCSGSATRDRSTWLLLSLGLSDRSLAQRQGSR